MGYYTYHTGELIISPEIPVSAWPAEFASTGDSVFLFEQQNGTQTVALVNGQVAVTGSPGVTRAVMRYEENIKGYTFSDELKILVQLAKDHHSRVDGAVYGYGEETGDVWRVRIENNVIHNETPQYLWPNGDLEPLR